MFFTHKHIDTFTYTHTNRTLINTLTNFMCDTENTVQEVTHRISRLEFLILKARKYKICYYARGLVLGNKT